MASCNISIGKVKKIWFMMKTVYCSCMNNLNQSGGTGNLRFSTVSTSFLNQSINGCIRRGNLKYAREFFDENPLSRNVVSWNSMISGYLKQGQMQLAQQLFDEMPVRDIVSYNAILSGMHMAKDPYHVYIYFLKLGRVGLKPNEFTFSIVISSLLGTSFNSLLLSQLHGLALRLSINTSVFVGSALIRAYCDVDNLKCLRKVFEEISGKDVSSWNALLLSYMDMGLISEAERAFDVMPETNVISWTTLIDGYIRTKNLDKARYVFQKASDKDKNVVMWTAMINGYTQNSMFLEAIELFALLLNSKTQPNCFTFTSVLNACSGYSSFRMGKQVHSLVLKYGFQSDMVLETALLDMYGNCGDLEASTAIFECMTLKSLTTWNSIIGCYSRHGEGRMALEMFDRLTNEGFKCDGITFVNVLSACGRGGLVDEGEMLFDCMRKDYGVEVEMEHYACMVDLYGRAGFLDKAVKLIEGMAMEPDVVVWGALLAGCCWHSSSEVGEFAARGLYKLKEDHQGIYSSLSKIYGDNFEWVTVADIKSMVKRKHVQKQKAGSWIDS